MTNNINFTPSEDLPPIFHNVKFAKCDFCAVQQVIARLYVWYKFWYKMKEDRNKL